MRRDDKFVRFKRVVSINGERLVYDSDLAVVFRSARRYPAASISQVRVERSKECDRRGAIEYDIDRHAVRELLRVLRRAHNLCSLTISEPIAEDKWVVAVLRALPRGVQELHLANCLASQSALTELRQFSDMQSLHFHLPVVDRITKQFCRNVGGMTQLRELSLENALISDECAAVLARSLSGLPHFERFALRKPEVLTNAGVVSILSSLRGMKALRLYCSRGDVSVDYATSFAAEQSPDLEELQLVWNHFGTAASAHRRHVASQLHCFPHLRVLDLSNAFRCGYPRPTVQRRSILAFADNLRFVPNLESLQLRQNRNDITALSDVIAFKYLLNAVRRLTKLTDLALFVGKLRSDARECLTDALSQLKLLESVELCGVDHDTTLAFVRMFHKLRNLRTFKMSRYDEVRRHDALGIEHEIVKLLLRVPIPPLLRNVEGVDLRGTIVFGSLLHDSRDNADALRSLRIVHQLRRGFVVSAYSDQSVLSRALRGIPQDITQVVQQFTDGATAE